jgi:hypothetical protein
MTFNQPTINQPPNDRSTQMFLDHGPDSFLGEVISLVRVKRLHIDIVPDRDDVGLDTVRVEFDAEIPELPLDRNGFYRLEFGRSYGQALRKIREGLRMELGR